ncbi:MAG: hypothetical protein GX589_02845, partial [Deltaproteobacteria bacterium]|nr:hypothetical protein [Deltaproteobacteria bacterium]
GGYPTRISKYLGTADTIGYQTYPIPSEPLSTLTSAYLNPIINDFAATGQPLISNLQTFGWYGTYRFPTPTETRNMTYQALAAGVQGILYYTYFDGDTDLSNQPALWSELQLIGAELTALEPYLVSGTHQRLNTDVSELYAAKWRVGSKLVVVVINASSTSNKTLALTLNDNLSGTRRNLFAYRSNLLSLSGKTLSGTLPPESVQVYELGLL